MRLIFIFCGEVAHFMPKNIFSTILGVKDESEIQELPLEDIIPSPYQPRETFDEEKLIELSKSISEVGLIQPIVVRKRGRKYEIVTGERRFEAVKKAGLKNIPAIVKSISETTSIKLALIENIQRENLKPIEEARAYQYLQEKLNLSQHDIAKTIGKTQPFINKMLKLLLLPKKVQEMLSIGDINQEQARVLLTLTNASEQIKVAQKIKTKNLSTLELKSYLEDKNLETISKENTQQSQALTPIKRYPTIHNFIKNIQKKGFQVNAKEKEFDNYFSVLIKMKIPKS